MIHLRLRLLVFSGLVLSPFYILWCICSNDSCNPIALSYERALNYNLNQPRGSGKRVNLRRKIHKSRKEVDHDASVGEEEASTSDGPTNSEDPYADVDTLSLLEHINSLQNASFATTHDATNLVKGLDVIYRGSHEYGREWRWFSPVVLEKYKLVFFLPPPSQNSSTWLQLFHKMNSGRSDNENDKNEEELQYLLDFSIREANEMMTSPEWTRAYFVLDPKLWFRQAYNSVVIQNDGHYLKNFPAKQSKCCLKGQTHQECFETITANPHKFIAALQRGCQDPYWNFQLERMEEKYWPYINFIGQYSNMAQDAKALLQKLGAWEQYGKTGWGELGNQAIFAQDGSESIRELKRWYSYNLEKKVFDFFDPDYQKFNLTKVSDYPEPTEAQPQPQTQAQAQAENVPTVLQ